MAEAGKGKLVLKPGVVVGKELMKLKRFLLENGIALPAFNCTSSSTINAVLEAAQKSRTPVIVQFSCSGAAFYAGKAMPNDKFQASIAGAVAGAHHVRLMAKHYGVPVVIHSDHCAKDKLPWFDGMLRANEAYFKQTGQPLFSSHMLDLSEENDKENIETCVKYFKKMKAMNIWLEMEIGITGGEEDGVDNTDAKEESLYTSPEQVWAVHKALSAISPMFSIAAAFGNVHGVYKPGNVKLSPKLLAGHQAYIKKQLKAETDKPTFLVMHGGSGSSQKDIDEAVKNGVIKMNVDTDTQWAYWAGVHQFYEKNKPYMQKQVGNPEGDDKPNKKFYDPRKWIREAEMSLGKRATEAFKVLGSVGCYGGPPAAEEEKLNIDC